MLTEHELTPTEATAVYRASENMRRWRERHITDDGRPINGRRFRTGYETKVTGPKPNPSAPIEELRKRGKIDGRRDAQLTALAFRMSMAEAGVGA